MPTITGASLSGGNQITLGSSNSVTITGSGFSAAPCSVALTATGLSVSQATITSRSDTSVTASFDAASNANSAGGTMTITVTAGGATSNQFRTQQITYTSGT